MDCYSNILSLEESFVNDCKLIFSQRSEVLTGFYKADNPNPLHLDLHM